MKVGGGGAAPLSALQPTKQYSPQTPSPPPPLPHKQTPKAVTCDDFLSAMSDANGGVDLSGIARWWGAVPWPCLGRYRVLHQARRLL